MQSLPTSRVVFSTMQAATPIPPMVAHLDTLITTLNDAPQDDVKYRALKEISETLEELAGKSAYISLADNLIRVFMRLLKETSPQFIAENNTLQLRKLMLELLLRLSSNDLMKTYGRNLQPLLLRLIYMENEENALLIIKFITDYTKTFRPPYSPELDSFLTQTKSTYKEMLGYAENEAMFLQRPFITMNKTIEESVVEALKTCYAPTTLSYSQQQQYTLIPKSSQSVKVLAEMSVFLLMLIQAHRQHLLTEQLEFVAIFMRYVNITTPHPNQQEDKLYNKVLIGDFNILQVRALSFISYSMRHTQIADMINKHAKILSHGIINLFDCFHDEGVTNQRRDLLIATKYFFQSDFRANFIDIIPKLCDDKALLGKSFTSQDQLRNQAYSFLADILHHVRMNLNHKLLMNIFFIASRNLHDTLLLPYVQTMYGKLMMNLIEAVVVQPKDLCEMHRTMLCSSIDSLVRKAKSIAVYHLPAINEKLRLHQAHQIDHGRHSHHHQQSTVLFVDGSQQHQQKDAVSDISKAFEASQSYWQDSIQPLALNDCKNMVRFIIQPVKMMTIALKDLGGFDPGSDIRHRIVGLLSDFFYHGLKCLDIFMNAANVTLPYPKISSTNMRSKEEKDTIEAFVSTFTYIDGGIFETIIDQHIEFLISRILINPTLQNVCNSFFMHHQTMHRMGTALVKILISKLSDLGGANIEKAALHLKLFKLVFQAVSFVQSNSESENILKPFLHQIVQDSMQLALTSRDSTNYFQLLRALFRSIGSGTHDLLYQQFLPLLPSILQQLNRLQNGTHRQHAHELFVELCLTIPVRLSSLLPYLPLLMDPLVCALNGSPNLVQQGLRTLELCVDNLQPDYLYEHMMPVRAALMKGLWQTMSCSDMPSALSALRILGKFGGSSRKVLLDSQSWDYRLLSESHSPLLAFTLRRQKMTASNNSVVELTSQQSCYLFSIREAVRSAVAILRSQGDAQQQLTNSQSTNFSLKIQAMEFVKNVLLLGIRSNNDPILAKSVLTGAVKEMQQQNVEYSTFICPDKFSRDTFTLALSGLFIAVYNMETRTKILPFFKTFTKHLTIMAVLESNKARFNPPKENCLDSSILLDAIIVVLGDSCKDYCHTAILALRFIMDTTTNIFDGDREKACQLPLFNYLIDRVLSLCYRREWYSRLGGCTALRMIIEHYPRTFVQLNAASILDACIEIISSLYDELSGGAIEFACKTVDLLIDVCFSPSNENPTSLNTVLLENFVNYLVPLLDDSDPILRKACMHIIQTISDRTQIHLINLLRCCNSNLNGNIHVKMREFASKSVETKIALIELFLFYACIDGFIIEFPRKELELFVQNLLSISRANNNMERIIFCLPVSLSGSSSTCNGISNEDRTETNVVVDDIKLREIKLVSTKALVVIYMKAATKMFSGSHSDCEENTEGGDIDLRTPQYLIEIFEYLTHCSLNAEEGPVRDSAKEGIKKIFDELRNSQSDHNTNLGLKLEELIDEFHNKKVFISKCFFDKLLFLTAYSSTQISPFDLQMIANDLSLIMQTSTASININDVECVSKGLELFHTVSYKNTEILKMAILFSSNCLFNFPTETQDAWMRLILPFMNAHSVDFPETFFDKELFGNENFARFLMKLLEFDASTLLRNSLLKNVKFIKPFIMELNAGTDSTVQRYFELHLLKFLAALLARDSEFDDDTIRDIFDAVRNLWCSDEFKQRHSVRKSPQQESMDHSDVSESSLSLYEQVLDESKFDCPSACAQILLIKFRSMLEAIQLEPADSDLRESIDLLYDLIVAFDHSYATDFTFLRRYIDYELIPKVSLVWRRETFVKVITLLKNNPKSGHSSQLVLFMQYIVTPCFAYAFEVNEADTVVGGAPYQSETNGQPQTATEDSDNIVVLMCREVIQQLTNDRTMMSDSLTIIMYLFCSLLVQKCPMHIYDPAKKQQGNRQEQGNLRHFMLFGWPCLQQSFQGDLTEKYAGHYLIANIIDKFSINRTIILQVLNSLIQAHHQDNKELVRKALDILIPAVPRRIPDGYLQLQTLFKKIMVEECRNSAQIVHCLQIIVRHYKVFYNIRHQIAQQLLSALHRLFTLQFNFDTRRLMLDVFEVIIKWEQDRQLAIEATNKTTPTEAGVETDGSLSNSPSSSLVAELASSQIPTTTGTVQQAVDIHKEMEKQFIDSIIMFIFRIATYNEQYSGSLSGGTSGMEQLNRRAIFLLRSALKPAVFGSVVTIHTPMLEKQLHLPNPEQFNTGNEQAINHQLNLVHVTLDVLISLTHHLTPQMILDIFHPLQHALIACMNYNNSQQILRSTYNVLSKLLEKTKCSATGLDEFEALNQHITRIIHDSFGNYSGALTASPPMATITLLRLMHSSQPSYLETVCLTSFIKLLQRLVREYVVCSPASTAVITDQAQKLISDLLAICLEMLCSRTSFFSMDSQRTVIQIVLIPLIEKGAVDKILEHVIRITQAVINTEIAFVDSFGQQQREETQQQLLLLKYQQSQGVYVLGKMFTLLEHRLVSHPELHRLFLHVIIRVYENEEVLGTKLDILQPAFYWGLTIGDHELQNRFFAVYQNRFPKDIMQRLLHIMSKENWQQMGHYYWLSHVVHLLLLAEQTENSCIELRECATLGNTLSELIKNSEPGMEQDHIFAEEEGEQDDERVRMDIDTTTKENSRMAEEEEPKQKSAELPGHEDIHSKVASMRISFSESTSSSPVEGRTKEQTASLPFDSIGLLSLANGTTSLQVISSIALLLHEDTVLCRKIFVEIFCSLWNGFDNAERELIEQLAAPFLSSAAPLYQKDSAQPSVVAFLEAFLRCSPPIQLEPFLLNYIGSNFNCWHFALLQLELLTKGTKLSSDSIDQSEEKLEALECLGKLYQQLNEQDQYIALWKKRAYFDKTFKCLTLCQQGEFQRAREMAEKLMAQLGDRLSKAVSADSFGAFYSSIQGEQRAWELCWINSCKQLNDWSALENFANTNELADAPLLMEASWHLRDGKLLNESIIQVDAMANPQIFVKSSLFKLMLNVSNFDQEHRLNKELIERQLLEINRSLLSEWRKIPSLVSHSHIELLHQAHLLHEISESANLLNEHLPTMSWDDNRINSNNSMLNSAVKHLMKSWRNRPMTTVDQNLSWLELFNWRHLFFNSILHFYETNSDQLNSSSFSLPFHALFQSHLQLARAFRHSNQLDIAQNELNKLHSNVIVYPLDAQHKFDEYVKCLLKLSSGDVSTTSKKITAQNALVEALEIIEGTQTQFLKRDQFARMMTNKGILLSRMDKRDEAGRAFSAAAQLDEMMIPSSYCSSVWKHWGEFLSNLYLSNHSESSALSTGIQAIACTLESARLAPQQKSRAAIAKLFWLLKIISTSPSEKLVNAVDELLFKYMDTLAPANWLFWLNEIIADVQQRPGNAMVKILKRISHIYPQQTFCAIRVELGPQWVAQSIEQCIQNCQSLSSLLHSSSEDQKDVCDVSKSLMKKEASKEKLFDVLNYILRQQLTNISTLNRMLDELDNFSISSVEATMNKLRQILTNCHFDQFTKISELATTLVDMQILKCLTDWFQSSTITKLVDVESDDIQGRLFSKLISDFNFCLTSSSDTVPLHRVASLLRKWIPQLCQYLRTNLGKSKKRLVDSSTYLAHFKSKQAHIELFDGHINTMPQFNSKISQFLPLYEEVVRTDAVYRLLRIRAMNGKIYSYQLERIRYDYARSHIFQLFILLNGEFAKCRNTAQRFIQFAIPSMLFTGANSRLMACCPLAGILSQLQNTNSDHSAQNFVVFTDILHEMINADNGTLSLSPLAVIDHYYNRLAEQRYSHKTIHELFNQISGMKKEESNGTDNCPIVVPKDLLYRWVGLKYVEPTTFWMARKKLAVHFALLGLSEHSFFLSSMTPDGLILDLTTAQLFFTDYRFDLTKKVCETISGKVSFIELDANRPVQFRLTPNISNFLGPSIDGHFTGALTAVARSLNAQSLEKWLRPILWDVFSKVAEDDPQLSIVNPVKRAVDTIVGRIKTISQIDSNAGGSGTSSSNQQTAQQLLIQHTILPDNLCRMDPAWHPWF